jgi:hypothetical protein
VITFQRLVQSLFLILFFLLVLLTLFPGGERVPADRFLLLDPVLALGAMISSRALLPLGLLLPALVVLIGTVLLGRFFCSHLCPLGTLQDLLAPLAHRLRKTHPPGSWRKGKYLVLALLLATALFGVNMTLLPRPWPWPPDWSSWFCCPDCSFCSSLRRSPQAWTHSSRNGPSSPCATRPSSFTSSFSGRCSAQWPGRPASGAATCAPPAVFWP